MSEKFFEINGIEESQKLKLASNHLEEKALHWFRRFEKSNSLRTWKDCSKSIINLGIVNLGIINLGIAQKKKWG